MLLSINKLDLLSFLKSIENDNNNISRDNFFVINDEFKKTIFLTSNLYSEVRAVFLFIKLLFLFKESYFFDLIHCSSSTDFYNELVHEFRKSNINFNLENIDKILFFKPFQTNEEIANKIKSIIAILKDPADRNKKHYNFTKKIVSFIDILNIEHNNNLIKIKNFLSSKEVKLPSQGEDFLERILINFCYKILEQSNFFIKQNIIFFEDFILNQDDYLKSHKKHKYFFILDEDFINIRSIMKNLDDKKDSIGKKNFNTARGIFEFRRDFLITWSNKQNSYILNTMFKEELENLYFLRELPQKQINGAFLQNFFRKDEKILEESSNILHNNSLLNLNLEEAGNLNANFQLSPSSISTLLTTPGKFFLEKIVKISLNDKKMDEEKNTKKGIVMHKICEEFQKKVIENRTYLNEDYFNKLAQDIIKSENLLYNFFTEKCLKNCYKKIFNLEEEKNKNKEGKIVNVYLEANFFYRINDNISLRAKIDRIEIDNLKNVNFFDFKTSSISEVERKEKNGLSPQLAICSFILKQNYFKINKMGYIYIGEKDEADKIYNENEIADMLQNAEKNIKNIAYFLQNYNDEDFAKINTINNSDYSDTKLSILFRDRKIFDLNEIGM